MMRTHSGRSLKGNTAQMLGPALKSRNIIIMAAICNDRLLHYEVLQGAGNSVAFAHFIDELAHESDNQNLPCSSVLVMDNVSFHRNNMWIEMMENRGFEFKFLPAYSPFLNPFENMFSQWKNFVKKKERVVTECAAVN